MNPETSFARGDYIQTFTGGNFYPFDPRPEEINIEDIAHALSQQCRFAGHTSHFYSVAEHSLFAADLVPTPFKLAALLHDAAEAYLVDLPRPIKHSIPEYQKIEHGVAEVIRRKYNLQPGAFEHPAVKDADEVALHTEAFYLMSYNGVQSWVNKQTVLYGRPFPLVHPNTVKSTFLRVFTRLTK